KVNLVNGVSIDVSVVGPEAGAAREQFTRVFNSVWGRLPASARAALAARWKIGAAVVFLTPRWKEQAGRLAQCSSGGLTFHFFSPALPRMTDDVLAECIVHELAHPGQERSLLFIVSPKRPPTPAALLGCDDDRWPEAAAGVP